MKDKLMLVFAVVMMCLLAILIVLFLKRNQKCDEQVIMEDGTKYVCKGVTSFNSGVSTINLCDDERITVPTYRIKMISRIKE